MLTNCIKCGKSIEPHRTRKYCGSLPRKQGCAYQVRLEAQARYMNKGLKEYTPRVERRKPYEEKPKIQVEHHEPVRCEFWFTT